jgi:hypothetical protein
VAIRNAVVIGGDQAANGGFDAKNLKVIAGDEFPIQTLSTSADTQIKRECVAADHAAEYLVAIAEVPIYRVGERSVAGVAAVVRALPFELHEVLGMLDRQPAQNYLVKQCEYGRVRPNAQGERKDGNAGKNWSFCQCPKSEAYVGDEIAHVFWISAVGAPSDLASVF